ncbi:tannase/feruloyl esterase family alpha/beta hydrolase [Gammaproteobacteria bacterium]|nr:tannase/feruloyl esterase family alpha/beta hydrolase [Gammaproteobacteria bacterium]
MATSAKKLIIIKGLVSVVASVCLGSGALAQDVSWRPKLASLNAAQACAELIGLKIPASGIGLGTTGATIFATELVRANARDNSNGEFCQVKGNIHPVTYSAPDIEFQVNLPSDWNGKSLQLGGGRLQWSCYYWSGTLCQAAGFRRNSPCPWLCDSWQ